MAVSLAVQLTRFTVSGICLASIAFGACTYHQPQRTTKDGTPAGPITTSQDELTQGGERREAIGAASIERHAHRFSLGVVEFDDQGQYWSRPQAEQVLADLRRTYASSPAGVQLIVFVHGWKHNASVCDENLACFRGLLSAFAEQEGEGGRPVYGVYIGWRGSSLKGPVLKELSFWGRKSAAQRIGHGDVVDLLATLETLHRQKRAESRGTRLTIIGHSFGAAVVYSATEQMLRERLATFAATRGATPRLFVGFGTLTVLVNPAFEAQLYEGIDTLIRLNPGLFDARNPRVLVTVASEGDWATRFAFPLGRFFGTVFQRTRGWEQRKQMLTSLGNYAGFETHRLELTSNTASSSTASRQVVCACPIQIDRDLLTPSADVMDRFSLGEDDEEFGRARLVKMSNSPQADSPLIVVRAAREVIADHNAIWSPPFVSFLTALIARTDALLMRQ